MKGMKKDFESGEATILFSKNEKDNQKKKRIQNESANIALVNMRATIEK